MIAAQCECGAVAELPESAISQPGRCAACGKPFVCISAEALPEGAGTCDFDARLVVTRGPSRVGESLLLGGCLPISFGKLPSNSIVLAGKQVSRAHGRLVRMDAGPSRWNIEDNHSTNGIFVNGQRITSHELQIGDVVRIGEYELEYKLIEATPVWAGAGSTEAAVEGPPIGTLLAPGTAPPLYAPGAAVCPSCDQQLRRGASICVSCGIRVPSGRPLITSQGLDEDRVHGNSETIISIVSWAVPVTPLPMPLISEAYGASKPYTIWSIAAITIVTSIVFVIALAAAESESALGLMLWPRNPDLSAQINERAAELELESQLDEPSGRSSASPAAMTPKQVREAQEKRDRLLEQAKSEIEAETPKFAWYQLIIHAFLHDPSSIFGLIMHLGGNMLFLIVFGSRVNALLGSIATAVVYPLLAIAAATAQLLSMAPDEVVPMLGASGAINGLAGLYLILFPAHRVYCAMWLRLRFWLIFKIFTLRGFWVLLIYFAFDTTMILIGSKGGTAHWAHVGGFLTGIGLGLVILFSRQFNCRNGDLLSVTLGRYAWPLIGKPSQWTRAVA